MNDIRFNKPIVEVDREELLLAFDGVIQWDESGAAISGFAEVTRAIILNELEFPSDTASRDERDIWYSSVKPVFSKLGMLRKPLSVKASPQAFLKGRTDKLSVYLSDFVQQGLFTFRDLGIIDHSRDQHRCAGEESFEKSSGYAVTFGMYPALVLATEKDTQYAELVRIARLYGCSAISGSGQCSFAATEKLINGIIVKLSERIKAKMPFGRRIQFLAFTDYDGFGYSIAETFATQARYCLKNIAKKTEVGWFGEIPVETVRLGINLDQLNDKEIEDNKYELAENPVNKKWFEETGGVDGEFYGLELNAMKHARRVEIITDGLNQLVGIEPFKVMIQNSYIRRVALDACHEAIEEALNAVVAQEQGNVSEPDITLDDLQQIAIEGGDEVPIECENDRAAAIAGAMLSELREALLQEEE